MDGLPRRAFLGLRLPAKGAFDRGGARTNGAVPGGMGAAAQIQGGDRVLRIGAVSIASSFDLDVAVRACAGALDVELEIERDGMRRVERVPLQLWPSETLAGHDVVYGEVQRPGARLRTISTRPRGTEALATIVFLQGIACSSVDYAAAPDAPFGQLVHGLAARGFATFRVEKRGVGDSEGECCDDADFLSELSDFAAAIPRSGRLVLFGHSVGGMIAPIVAATRPVDAVVVYGTSARRWRDCLVASARRQLLLRGLPEDEVEERVARFVPAQRAAAYHEQLDALDLEAEWRKVECPVLVLRGEYDWVVDVPEQEKIVELVARGRSQNVPGIDHALSAHASIQDSLDNFGGGRFDHAVVEATARFLVKDVYGDGLDDLSSSP